jgi:D-glycerate 3-kinase
MDASRHRFPPAPFEALLRACGIDDSEAWQCRWSRSSLLHDLLQRAGLRDRSIVWGVTLPLLERLRRLAGSGANRVVGLSGLPGCGKSTLTELLARLASAEGLRLAVASIDDFYYPGEALDRSMAGNPWQAPRALPGSHDVDLLQQTLTNWRQGGGLRLPRFDKSLREARGDRSGWWQGEADVLLLEGWFLGCRPLGAGRLATLLASGDLPRREGLTAAEVAWLPRIDAALNPYQAVWNDFTDLWLLWPERADLTRRWKAQQEATMRRRTGRCLSDDARERFVRMILNGLPRSLYHQPLLDPLAEGSRFEALALLDGRRRCLWSGPLSMLPPGLRTQLASSSADSSIG